MNKEDFKELVKSESKHYDLGAERNAFLEGVSFVLRQEYADQVKPEWIKTKDRQPAHGHPCIGYHKSGFIQLLSWNVYSFTAEEYPYWMEEPVYPEK